jgi:hypothetical protein
MVKPLPEIKENPVGAVGADITVAVAKLEFTLPTELLIPTQ